MTATTTTVTVEWTRRRHNQMVGNMSFGLLQGPVTLLLTRAANRAVDGTHRYLVRTPDETFTATGTLDGVAQQAAEHLGVTGPLDVQQTSGLR
ncbi:hypothetical protein AB0J01_28435 [Streptomyces sp. NPDC050204]|uniref:hypothetical protein n=1 Tax=Streptomyces sp. NPDC050204 TaxID=3155514 RepID=UPI00343758EA